MQLSHVWMNDEAWKYDCLTVREKANVYRIVASGMWLDEPILMTIVIASFHALLDC